MIPVFGVTAAVYGLSVAAGEPDSVWRWVAMASFFFASVSDGIDGYVARHFGQMSDLGRLLDPLADKALMLTSVLLFSFLSWYPDDGWRFPLWFATVVVARDSLSIFAAFAINSSRRGGLEVRPHWTGKVATVALIVTLSWIMLQLPHPEWPTIFAGTFVVASGAVYTWVGSGQFLRGIQEHAHSGGRA